MSIFVSEICPQIAPTAFKFSKFSRGGMPPNPPTGRRAYGARIRAFGTQFSFTGGSFAFRPHFLQKNIYKCHPLPFPSFGPFPTHNTVTRNDYIPKCCSIPKIQPLFSLYSVCQLRKP